MVWLFIPINRKYSVIYLVNTNLPVSIDFVNVETLNIWKQKDSTWNIWRKTKSRHINIQLMSDKCELSFLTPFIKLAYLTSHNQTHKNTLSTFNTVYTHLSFSRTDPCPLTACWLRCHLVLAGSCGAEFAVFGYFSAGALWWLLVVSG